MTHGAPRCRGLALAVAVLLVVAAAHAARAEGTCPCPEEKPPPPLWTGSAGVSYNATSGNTDTSGLGLDVTVNRQPTPWGLEIRALANRAETDGVKTAERYFGGLRGKRALGERNELFLGGSWSRDRFAGFDSRVVLEAGDTFKALLGPVHELSFDVGLTWTEEDPVAAEKDSFAGALLGAAYVWKFTDTASFRERVRFFPSFEDSSDWRLTSETAIEAAIAAEWALRVSYLYARDNVPPDGFGKDDSATAVSLVWKR